MAIRIGNLDSINPVNREQLGPYADFDPKAYIAEYYSEVGAENEFLLRFYHDIFSQLPEGMSLLEFGGGPTVYQLFSASRKVTEIVFTDYLPCNLKEVANWLANSPTSFSWERFARTVALLEGDDGQSLENSSKRIEERTRSAVSAVAPCDALTTPAIASVGRTCFDIVSSGFCLECISGNEEAFKAALLNVLGWISPNGYLVLTLLKNSNRYRVGDKDFPAYPIDTQYIDKLLHSMNYRILELRETNAEQEQGYDGLIALLARRN